MKNKSHKVGTKVVLIIFIFLIIGLVTGWVWAKQKSNTELKESYSEHIVPQINMEDIENEFEDDFIDKEDEEMQVVSIEDVEQEEKKNEKTTKQTEEGSNSKNTGNTAYFIKVNKLANVVTIYGKDGNGEYTVPIKAMTCSTGTYTPAVSKYPNTKYKITGYKSRWGRLQGNVYGQYATQIVGNILFHSVPYTEKNNSSLEYWEYDKLGTTASAGCIRLTVADAKWIYENISKGTTVEFYLDSNPGPLGKPATQKISSNIEYRGWDPTDTTEGNPWRNMKSEEKIDTAPENTVENKIVQEEIKSDTDINEVKEQQNTNEEIVNENNEKINIEQENIEKTNTEKTNTEKTNTEETNTENGNIEKNNTEKTNTEEVNTETENTENTNIEKPNTEETNTEKENTEKTNAEKPNTEEVNAERENIEKTNTEKSNTEETNDKNET